MALSTAMWAAAITTAVVFFAAQSKASAGCRPYKVAQPAAMPPRFDFSVNVVVRTHPGKASHLLLMLGSLLLAAARAENVSLHVLVMNTDSELYSDTSYIRDALQEQSRILQACRCATLEIVKFPEAPWDGFYGYDYTQHALERLLDDSSARADYYLFTNGDNLFSDVLFLNVLPYFEKAADLVAYSFVSHHFEHAIIPVEYKVAHIDLSAVFFRSSMLRQHRAAANFVPLGHNTTGLWEADWYFIERLIKQDGVRAEVAPGVLLFHQ